MNTLNLYDQAIEDKFKEVFENSIYADPVKAFKESAKANNNEVKLPLLSVYRSGLEPDFARHANLGNRGRLLQKTVDKETGLIIKALPSKISYTLDIWTQSRSDLNHLLEELLFYLLEFPALYIEFEIEDQEEGLQIESHIELESVTDQTDLSQSEEEGLLYRTTIEFHLGESNLYNFKEAPLPTKIPVTYYVNNKKDGEFNG
ncbi:hypothetical protein HSE3_gp070 [Bacillus phage vB_BceM-HSE3]|nr:hypothetical protein HSE3_gp070 [Bacillus phage vB_BceM-HSE3]